MADSNRKKRDDDEETKKTEGDEETEEGSPSGETDVDFNPRKREDNCGYCSIAKVLYDRTKILVTADELYDGTIAELGIDRTTDGRDPISRMLFFPERDADQIPIPTSHEALKDRNKSGKAYTLDSVAAVWGLSMCDQTGSTLEGFLLPFLNIACETSAPTRFHELAERRLRSLTAEIEKAGGLAARRPRSLSPSTKNVEDYCKTTLSGDFIIGMKLWKSENNHFINLKIDGSSGDMVAFDAQTHGAHLPKELRDMGRVTAVVHVENVDRGKLERVRSAIMAPHQMVARRQ